MNSIDIILLAGIIATAACVIAIPRRIDGILKPLVGGIGLLVLVQLLSEGFYWQYVSAYLLLAVLTVLAIFPNTFKGSIQKRLLQLALIVLALASMVPWAVFLPVPQLIEPQGQYTVGTRIFRWVDHSRPEHITSDADDRRNVVVQAWYPTGQDANGPHSSYMDGLGSLPDKIGILPGFVFDH